MKSWIKPASNPVSQIPTQPGSQQTNASQQQPDQLIIHSPTCTYPPHRGFPLPPVPACLRDCLALLFSLLSCLFSCLVLSWYLGYDPSSYPLTSCLLASRPSYLPSPGSSRLVHKVPMDGWMDRLIYRQTDRQRFVCVSSSAVVGCIK